MTNQYLKMFGEPSKTVSVRVPISQHTFYKERFNSIVKQDFKNYDTNLVSELKLAMNSLIAFINGASETIKLNSSISFENYKILCNRLEFGAIKSVQTLLNNLKS